MAGGRGEMPQALPLIVEIIHGGSLVIDDVEDDSSLRRGGACLHRLYGVPIAINVGNWMYFWALDLVGGLGLAEERAGALQRALTQGMFRCHFGQALDLSRPVGRHPAGRDGRHRRRRDGFEDGRADGAGGAGRRDRGGRRPAE